MALRRIEFQHHRRRLRRAERGIEAPLGRTLMEVIPIADRVLRPPWLSPEDDDQLIFGLTMREVREFSARALDRRLKVIGLVAVA